MDPACSSFLKKMLLGVVVSKIVLALRPLTLTSSSSITGNNRLTGSIPSELASLDYSVEYIDLSKCTS